jgi:transcriptional regulator with XRE-family HTH domain
MIDHMSTAPYSVDVAKVKTRQLSHSELGRLLGLSASGVSYMRRGARFPSPKVQAAMVKRLGATWPELNAALVAGKRQSADAAAARAAALEAGVEPPDPPPNRWARYVEKLAEVRCEPAKGAEAPPGPGRWVQRRDGTWLKLEPGRSSHATLA